MARPQGILLPWVTLTTSAPSIRMQYVRGSLAGAHLAHVDAVNFEVEHGARWRYYTPGWSRPVGLWKTLVSTCADEQVS